MQFAYYIFKLQTVFKLLIYLVCYILLVFETTSIDNIMIAP